ncbi:MAG: class I SAM-dependent methyltransferase [Verrucomicrobia subdivision 3 bacterium]|nr:class I SAM-dependent methyltransferase [Limisphaerales bacterium]
MPFYRNHVYPWFVNLLGNPGPIKQIRQRIIPMAEETVLEVGVGPGVNFPHYDPAKVSKLYALEPNSGMIRLAERQRSRSDVEVEFLDLPGERIPLEDGTVDTVVSTFTLCTIPAVVEAIRGIGRVLRPGGKFIFFEHGVSPDHRVQCWQRLWEPFHRCVFQGCHLTRDIPALITQGGFRIGQMERSYLVKFPKSWTHCWWGTATQKR